MNRLSLDNGNTYINAEQLADHEQEINAKWDALVELMDDTARGGAEYAVAPCSNLEFLRAYLKIADSDLVIG